MMRALSPYRGVAALRGFVGARRGNVAVDFALCAPVLFMLIFGIIELGYALWLQNALDDSVTAASRCASINSSACSGQVTTYAAGQSGAPVDSSAFIYTPAAGCGCQVTASYSMPLLIPFLNLSVNLSSQSCYVPPPKNSCAS